MTKKFKNSFKLIIVIIALLLFVNLLQISTYAIDPDVAYRETGVEESAGTEDTTQDNGLMGIIRKTIAQWYYVFRYFSIAAMLIVLIYLGIKLAISSIAEDKAKYKRMLADWIVGFIIIFGIHYFMILVLKLNDICINAVSDIATKQADKMLLVNEEGLTGAGLYETIRTRAYEFRFGVGTSGMIMYMILVYYTVRFILVYFKRFFTILILTIMAPLAALSYAFTKVNTGKAPILTKWAQEYTYNVFLQTIHALLYGVFVSMALILSTESIVGFILALIMLNFMLKADKIFRKIFKFSGSLLDSNDNSNIKENLAALTAAKASMHAVTGNQMAKDFKDSAKRKIGAVTNTAMYGGLSAYSKILDKNEKKNKNYQELLKNREILNSANEELKNAKTTEEQATARAKLDAAIDGIELNSTKQTARMENRRNRLNKYKAPDNKAIEKETSLRIAKARKNGIVDEQQEKQIRKDVEKEYSKKIKRRTVEFNKQTGKYEVTDGIAKQLKTNLNTAIWGNNKIKGATKDMVGNTLKGISGAAMIFASIPQIVAEPAVGMALLGKGISNAKLLYGNNEYKDVTTAGYRRNIKKVQRKNIKRHKQEIKDKKQQKYAFNRFNPKSLDTIKAQIRMDSEANMIRRINSPSLGVKIFTAPLRLTGITSAVRNINSYSYKVNEAIRDRAEILETAFTIEKKDSLNKDFMNMYNSKIANIDSKSQAILR